MKKQLSLAVSLLTVFICAHGQKPDTAWLMLHYKFTWVRDTANREHPYTENMVLFVGKSASAYRSYDGLVADRQFKKAYAEAVASSPDGKPEVNRRHAGSGTQYFQYPLEYKLYTRAMMFTGEYVIEDAMPVINWKISGDTATFGGLHCQEATCHFKGRDYVVWFCPDLPVHTGPWKLNGLPGVIVDARDTKNEVIFKFDGVEKTAPSPLKDRSTANTNETANTDPNDVNPLIRDLNDDPNLIEPPARAIKTTQDKFDKMQAAVKKNPEAVAQAINSEAGRGSADKPMIRTTHGNGAGLNNPIELSEK
jgi:GLPGLI family protein